METFPFSRRLFWMLLVAAIQSIYLPASRAIGGIAPKLPFEPLPIYPVWVIPYYLCYPLWIFGIAWALFRMDARSFRALILAALLTVSAGAATFIFFPTYIELPAIAGSDVFSVLLRAVQVAGGTHAALPSAHNYITMLMSAFAIHTHPHQRWIWIAVVVIVALSTIFTGQHYLLDMVTGLALGWIGYRFGWIFAERFAKSKIHLA